MSTSYYLVQTETTPLYGQLKVAETSGGKTSLWQHEPYPEWVDEYGDQADCPDITMPASVSDLKALVASGRYRFVDEYGVDRDVEEVFG